MLELGLFAKEALPPVSVAASYACIQFVEFAEDVHGVRPGRTEKATDKRVDETLFETVQARPPLVRLSRIGPACERTPGLGVMMGPRI